MDLKKEKFIVMMKKSLQLRFKLINLKKCGKKFNTDISEIVEENSNFTHVFKSKCLELVVYSSDQCEILLINLKQIRESIFYVKQVKTGYLNMKTKTKNLTMFIRTIIFFNVKWVKINGVLNYRFTLFNNKTEYYCG